MEDVIRVPEARYAYYRRCQVFRRGGEQCKAPAEKGSQICYAHAGQLATAVRRERERRAVLEEAVAQMRRRGKPQCEMADLFMDFKGINMTLSVMAQALIDGRIDCKTAGRLVVQLQTVSKLLWLHHRGSQRTATALTTKDTKEHKESPQICAEERRLGREKASTTKDTKEHEGRKTLPRINTDDADLRKAKESRTAEARRRGEQPNAGENWAANERERTRWMVHRRGREGRKEKQFLPQICAEERRLGREKASTTKDTKEHEGRKTLPRINTDDADLRKAKESLTAEARRRGEEQNNLPRINTDNTDLKKQAEGPSRTAEARRRGEQSNAGENWAANERERTRMALVTEVLAIANRRGWAHAPPELLRAA